VIKALLLTFAIAIAFGVGAYLYGTLTLNTVRDSWREWQQAYQIEDMPAFHRVGSIHNMGYIGGAVGSIVAGIWLRKQLKKRTQTDHLSGT
jgi:hypothetical protein